MKRCKGRHRRLLVGLTVSTTVLFVLSPGIALADEIVDPPDVTVDTVDSTTDATIDTVDSTTDSTTETVTDPIVEVVSEPAPEVASEPLPTPISELVPAPVASAPEPEVPATVDETPMTVTATTELYSSEDGESPRSTSEELPQKLQDDPFNSPELEGIGHAQALLMVTSSQATIGSQVGSVQVDGPVSCSGSAPCGVRNSPNDPGSFVESIAGLLRQLALTGSGALDLMKLAFIFALVGALAIWGTRRRHALNPAHGLRFAAPRRRDRGDDSTFAGAMASSAPRWATSDASSA